MKPTAEGQDHAGVIVLPPLLYLGAFVVMMLLRWPWPMPILGGGGSRWGRGWSLVALGITPGRRRSRRALEAAGTHVNPGLPTTRDRDRRPSAGSRATRSTWRWRDVLPRGDAGGSIPGGGVAPARAGAGRHAPGRHPPRGALPRAEVRRCPIGSVVPGFAGISDDWTGCAGRRAPPRPRATGCLPPTATAKICYIEIPAHRHRALVRVLPGGLRLEGAASRRRPPRLR